MAKGGSTNAEPSPHYSKAQGSNPANSAYNERDRKCRKSEENFIKKKQIEMIGCFILKDIQKEEESIQYKYTRLFCKKRQSLWDFATGVAF